MDYRVLYAEDDLMPEGRDWLICTYGAVTTLYVRKSVRSRVDMDAAAVLESAWMGFLDMQRVLPQQRQRTA